MSSNVNLLLSQEIQSKRQERKRRTTANPVYSGAVFEPEVLLARAGPSLTVHFTYNIVSTSRWKPGYACAAL